MKREIEKPWGKEKILHADNKYVMKELHIRKGKRLSLQYHIYKEETLYLVKGEAEIYMCSPAAWAMGEEYNRQFKPIKLKSGGYVTIQEGWIHRIEAIKDSIFLECSTPELWDVERIEDDFGRVGNK